MSDDFQINTYTTGEQDSPAIAFASGSQFVAVWGSGGNLADGPDGENMGIQGRIFSSDGTPLGSEFTVNSFTTGPQRRAAVGVDSAGNFLVVWQSGDGQVDGPDGSGTGVQGQSFAANAVPLAGEFQINTYTTGGQFLPALAMDDARLVVVWESQGQDGASNGILGRLSDNPFGGPEFLVNTYTTGLQEDPVVALDELGRFVVVWVSVAQQDGSARSVQGQCFDAEGDPFGGEFQVNSYTTGPQRRAAVATDRLEGDFIVVWDSSDQDGDLGSIHGQRYNPDCTRLGPEFQINSYTTGSQTSPAIAMDSAGNFVVVWGSEQDGDLGSIQAQAFTSDGQPLGGEFQVNSYTTELQRTPRVSMDAAGVFVVTWVSRYQDGDSTSIQGRRFNLGFQIFADGFESGDMAAW